MALAEAKQAAEVSGRLLTVHTTMLTTAAAAGFMGYQSYLMRTSIQQVERTIVAAEKQVGASIEANNIVRDHFNLTQHPWLSGTVVIRGPMMYHKTGEVTVPVEVIMKNNGQLPALFANVHIEMIPFGGDKGDHIKEQNRICGELRKEPLGTGWAVTAHSIFPSETRSEYRTLGIVKKDIDAAFPNSEIFAPYLVGCVDYTTVLRDRHHHTGFVYIVNRTRNGLWGTFTFEKSGSDVPLRNLFISPFGGNYVD